MYRLVKKKGGANFQSLHDSGNILQRHGVIGVEMKGGGGEGGSSQHVAAETSRIKRRKKQLQVGGKGIKKQPLNLRVLHQAVRSNVHEIRSDGEEKEGKAEERVDQGVSTGASLAKTRKRAALILSR